MNKHFWNAYLSANDEDAEEMLQVLKLHEHLQEENRKRELKSLIEDLLATEVIREQPIQVVWPIPKAFWYLMHLWPFNRRQHIFWAVGVDSDGTYRVEKEL